MEFVFDTGDHEDIYQNESATRFHYNEPKFSNSSARKTVVTGLSDIEFTSPPPAKRKATAPVKYVKPLPKKRKSKKKKFELNFTSIFLLVCVGLVIRLVSMEGGVADYIKMDNVLNAKKKELARLSTENIELKKEIHLINTSSKYQEKLARKHLGVIANNEYLVLFGKNE